MNQEKFKQAEKIIDFNELKMDLSKRRDVIFDDPSSLGRLDKRLEEMSAQFLEELLERKDEFKFVFKTSKGSYYFVSESDLSLRITKTENGYKTQPIMAKIIFISSIELEKLQEMKKSSDYQEGLIDYVFKKSKLSENVIPIEIGLDGYSLKVVFEENEENIKILGTRFSDGEKINRSFAAGIHVGHPVLEIIKL